ncbi:hypothetical protein [Bacillus sp. FJAT-49736]|uniref:hypothetical protein n=1 Tax=Bacillus sp. FJAT-49736 TaxID=2833582 RepID=UPI001BC9F328|nr:hypothetical protein [Bacillus sp. FJAT-49736]MBS4174863.1 hypothetical protein [Bacillus sp. FJAT-49736]
MTRLTGTIIFIGGILILIATILHPPLVNPYAGRIAFHEFNHSGIWMWDHILMLIGMFLWLGGLAGSSCFISMEKTSLSKIGSAMFYISLSLWIIVLTAELTILPIIGEEVLKNQQEMLVKVWEANFSFGLLAGYIAVACGWIGIIFYGLGIKPNGKPYSVWFKNSCVYSGIIGTAGIFLTFCFFKAGLILLPLTSGPVFLWTLWWGWKLVKGTVK